MSGSKRSDSTTNTLTKGSAKLAREALSQDQRDELSALRRVFFKRAREEATRWGGESVDLAWTYYPHFNDDQERDSIGEDRVDDAQHNEAKHPEAEHTKSAPRLVTDRVHLPRVGVTTLELIESIADDW